MKNILNPLVFLFLLLAGTTSAQKDTSVFYLDSTLHAAPKSEAVCIQKVYKKDGLWNTDISYLHKPYKIMSGSYKDRSLEVREGIFQYYNNNVMIMSGYFHHGLQDGIWKKWAVNGLLTDSVYFDEGNIVGQAKFQYHDNNHLWRYSLETNAHEKITRVFDTLDVLVSEGHFKEKDGEMFIYYPTGKIKSHAIYKDNQRVLYEMFDDKGNKL
jgi:antitoxin component YwqK of YwqJK toxin-antitoxin module